MPITQPTPKFTKEYTRLYVCINTMATNRLKLDFSLNYQDERQEFLNQYLTNPEFTKHPPNAEELETMANYLLWGKNRTTGLNSKQDGSVELSSRHGDWDDDAKVESLDALMESPTFNENVLKGFEEPVSRVRREVFSRKEALAQCPESMRDNFEQLFRLIDTIDLSLNLYEIKHGKRTEAPRESLTKKFSEEEQRDLAAKVEHWTQFKYLKQRHELIELRRQQYTLRDAYAQIVAPITAPEPYAPIEGADFEAGIEVLPLGLVGNSKTARIAFCEIGQLDPCALSEQDLRALSSLYWQKHSYTPGEHELWIDFRELEHVYELFNAWEELSNVCDASEEWNCNTNALMRTLDWYINAADLTELQRDILDMKIKKKRNVDIAEEVNKKWGKSYTTNYISTIFRQRIIPKINDVAKYQMMIVENLSFPEEFKRCAQCGRILLRDPINFTRKARSKDGFTSKCKKCEKEARQGGKDE